MIFFDNIFHKVLLLPHTSSNMSQIAIDMDSLQNETKPIHHLVDERSLCLPRPDPHADPRNDVALKIPIGTSAAPGIIFAPRVRPGVAHPPADNREQYYSYSIPVPGSSGPIFFDPRFPPVTRGVPQQK
jgi:hypothetical protein